MILFINTLLIMIYILLFNSSFQQHMSKISFMDKYSTILICLTNLVLFSMFIMEYKTKDKFLFLTMITLWLTLILSFMFNSLLYFFVFFEFSLIPTMFLILIWGYQPERLQASIYMLMYTMTASMPLLLGLVYILYFQGNTTFLPIFFNTNNNLYNFIWIIFIFGFLVKFPVYFFHLWLPKAHVEAPTYGSMILAAILLKLGGYGLYRISFIINNFSNSLKIISIFGILGGLTISFICMIQTDLKMLIAYSSITHMSYVIISMCSFSFYAMMGSLIILTAHGLCSALLFYFSGSIYKFNLTRNMNILKGLILGNSIFYLIMFLSSGINMSIPPSLSLMGEIITMISILMHKGYIIMILFLMGMMVGGYSLYLFSSLMHNKNNITKYYSLMMYPMDMFLTTLFIFPLMTAFLIIKPLFY